MYTWRGGTRSHCVYAVHQIGTGNFIFIVPHMFPCTGDWLIVAHLFLRPAQLQPGPLPRPAPLLYCTVQRPRAIDLT